MYPMRPTPGPPTQFLRPRCVGVAQDTEQPQTQVERATTVRRFDWNLYPPQDRAFVQCLAHALHGLYDQFLGRAFKFPQRYCSTVSRLIALMFPFGTIRVVSSWRGGSWTWKVTEAGHEWALIRAPSGNEYIVDMTPEQYTFLVQPEVMPPRARQRDHGPIAIAPRYSVPAAVYDQIDYERHINKSLVVDVLTDMESLGGIKLSIDFLRKWTQTIIQCYRAHGAPDARPLPLQ